MALKYEITFHKRKREIHQEKKRGRTLFVPLAAPSSGYVRQCTRPPVPLPRPLAPHSAPGPPCMTRLATITPWSHDLELIKC